MLCGRERSPPQAPQGPKQPSRASSDANETDEALVIGRRAASASGGGGDGEMEGLPTVPIITSHTSARVISGSRQ